MNLDAGNLYELNKDMVEKRGPVLTEEEINTKKDLVIEYIKDTNNKYYMLLNKERADYTIFNLKEKFNISEDINAKVANEVLSECEGFFGINKSIAEMTNILIDECCLNRGDIKGIATTGDGEAIEIWLSYKGESSAYYFFAYDNAVIEV